MNFITNTFNSGYKFEDDVLNIVKNFCDPIWQNIRIETLLTEKGYTELDVVFCLGDKVVILECKHILEIIGKYGDDYWILKGNGQGEEITTYKTLNVIVQNNIHVRSFMDLYYSIYKSWPEVISAIIVPDECKYDEGLNSMVYNISDLKSMLTRIGYVSNTGMHRRLLSLFTSNKKVIARPDFIYNREQDKRVKGDTNGYLSCM